MAKNLVRGPFEASVTLRDQIFISRDGASIRFSAGEGDKLQQLLLSVMAIESYTVLPSRLESTPFEVRFDSNRKVELRRMEQHPDAAGVSFAFVEGDDLIGLVQAATAKFLDKKTIRGRLPAKAAFSLPDFPIDGR